ncbi:U4/U6-U5 snRNP complex subunit lsm6 [Paramecium bursaria]
MSIIQKEQKDAKTPADFFKQMFGRTVRIKLHNRIEYLGVLAVIDGNMNIVLEQCEEYIDGKLSTKYGEAFIRGNNVLYISAAFGK